MPVDTPRRLSSDGLHVGEERRDSDKKDRAQLKKRWYQLLGKHSTPADDSDEPSSLSTAAASPTAAPSPTSSIGSIVLSSRLQLTHASSFTSVSSTNSTSSSTSASSASGWSFIRKSKALLSSPDGQSVTRPIPPPINTTALLSPSPTPDRPHPTASPPPTTAAPSLHLPIADVVNRAAFASSFRSFLVSRYCQENIDFLLAVNRFAQSYQREHPGWRVGEGWDGGRSEEERGRVVYAASVKESGVDIAHDKSHYVSLDIEATADSAPTGVSGTVNTNLPRTALDIYHTYILLTGSQTVNIPAHTRLAIEHTVNSLQQHNSSGTERQPLSATLTPSVFAEAVEEIERLLEREWLTKYYHTQQYAMLVQWMDKRERNILKKEQATRQKRKLQEQLRRVAAAVRTPEPSSQSGLQPVKGSPQRVHVSIGTEGVELHLTPQCSPLSPASADAPLSPISSTLRPSAVRAVGRLKVIDSEDRIEMFSVSGSVTDAGWNLSCDPETPTTPFTPSVVSSAAPLTPITPLTPQSTSSVPLFHPTPTPNMYLSPRRDNPRRVPPQLPHPIPTSGSTEVDRTPEHVNTSSSSSAASASSLLSASFLLTESPAAVDTTASFSAASDLFSSPSSSVLARSPFESPAGDYAVLHSPLNSTPSSTSASPATPGTADKADKRRRPQAIVTPLPFSLHEADDEHKELKLRFHAPPEGGVDEEHIELSRPPTLVIQYDDHDDDSTNKHRHIVGGDVKHSTHSPEPSTASLSPSPSPVAGAWAESSTSNKRRDKSDNDGGDSECGSEVDEDEEDRELFEGSTDGTRFFSVIVVEDSSDDELDHGDKVQVPV